MLRPELLQQTNLFFDSLIVEGGQAWFSAENFNGLFQIDLNTFEVKFVSLFPEEEILQQGLYYNGIRHGEYLVFAPAAASHIAIYHKTTGEFTSVALKNPGKKERRAKGAGAFFSMAGFRQYIFLAGMDYPAIIRLDMESRRCIYLDGWVRQIERIAVDKKSVYFRRGIVVLQEKLFLACCCANAILELDMEKLDFKIHRVGSTEWRFRDLCYDGKNFWLSLWDTCELVRWRPCDGSFDRWSNPLACAAYGTSALLVSGKKIIVFPLSNDNRVFAFDTEMKTWSQEAHFPAGLGSIHPWRHAYSFAEECQGQLFFYSGETMAFGMSALGCHAPRLQALKFSDLLLGEWFRAAIAAKKAPWEAIMAESKENRLESFLSLVCCLHKLGILQSETSAEMNSGFRIHKAVRSFCLSDSQSGQGGDS